MSIFDQLRNKMAHMVRCSVCGRYYDFGRPVPRAIYMVLKCQDCSGGTPPSPLPGDRVRTG